jgi:hypothetical protein
MEKSGISIWKKSLSDTIQQDKQVESVALSAMLCAIQGSFLCF